MTNNPFAPRTTEAQREEARGIVLSGKVKSDAIVKRFGSLARACEIAKVPYAKLIETGKLSDEDLRRRLRTVHEELGRPLTSVDIKVDARVRWWVYAGRSGSPARAGVKSPERETTRWTAVRPPKEIEG